MRDPIVFLHLISAMVLFGLPLAFGRFLGTMMKLGDRGAQATADALRLLTRRYLYLAWGLNYATGLYLMRDVVATYGRLWTYGAIAISILTLMNIVFGLDRGLSRAAGVAQGQFESLRKRLIVFSVLHHGFVTTLTFWMVFRGHFV